MTDLDQCPDFLWEAIPSSPTPEHPFITLTYAQSLDAKIAGKGRKQVKLSGEESMTMTHWMRILHDGIMVGIGTLINDDPRLNVRLLPAENHHLTPRPIVLDPFLRFPSNARMLQALKDPETPHAKQPIVLCAKPGQVLPETSFAVKRAKLEAEGAKVVPVDMPHGHLSLNELPAILQSLSIRSLMVEGGASIIQEFLAASRPSTTDPAHPRPLVDAVIITVAPVFIPDGFGLQDGLPAGQIAKMPVLHHTHTTVLGRDAVMVLKV